ncbi:hypothetical protein [Streptomyces sp. FIT100]|nr:hypothetical protein [Streptomyces sp. FIT100]UUN27435.1 hypothetical protein KK483_14280 [Streptomyces sp. FIT100]
MRIDSIDSFDELVVSRAAQRIRSKADAIGGSPGRDGPQAVRSGLINK